MILVPVLCGKDHCSVLECFVTAVLVHVIQFLSRCTDKDTGGDIKVREYVEMAQKGGFL